MYFLRQRVTMSAAARGLRTVKSAPNLRRGIKNSAPAPQPSMLLNSQSSQYTSMSMQALKTECKKKGLKVSGRKGELVDRLSSHDAARLTNNGIADVKHVSTKASTRPSTSTTQTSSAPTSTKQKLNKWTSKLQNKQSQSRPQATSAAAAPGGVGEWLNQVDRIKLPAGWQMTKEEEVPFKIPVPPDSKQTTQATHTAYTTPKPDDGKTLDNSGYSASSDRVHVLGNESARRLEDDSAIDRLSGDANGDYKEHHYRHEEFSSKDKRFLAGFAATVTGWWMLGKVGRKGADEHEHEQ